MWNLPHLRRACLVASLGLSLPAGTAKAEPAEFGGHIKYQFTATDYRTDDIAAAINDDPASDHYLDLRLKAEKRQGSWDLSLHYELLGLGGDQVQTDKALAAAGMISASEGDDDLPNDNRRLLDLTDVVADTGSSQAVQRLDRFSIGYRTEDWVLRLGRQAISWGNGLVFHPLDFVNPFSPIAIDKDYKTGDDMGYFQWAGLDGGDLQAILLPRRDPISGDVEESQGTAALKYHFRRTGLDVDVLAARHFDESLYGVGLAQTAGDLVWRLDATYTVLSDTGDDAISLVTNVDYSWTWGGKNAYGYVEYFRSGVGESEEEDYVNPNPALTARLLRGELFTVGRDYAAVGLRVELTPLVNLYDNLIWNMNDGSLFLQMRAVYDWQEDFQLMFGVNVPIGDRGTEFGGIQLEDSSFFTPSGTAFYLRGSYYF